MAITYRGTAVSWMINGNDSLEQNLFVIENGIASRVDVNIRKISIQLDTMLALATVMPIVKTSRCTTPFTGGTILSKCAFDTTQTSDDAVIIKAPISTGNPIVGDESVTIWQQYTSRLHTVVEQVIAVDNELVPKNFLPYIVELSGNEFILKPGESLLIQIVSPTIITNRAISDNWFVECLWEEEALATFAIGGVVTLMGVPVDGAKVIVVEAQDELMTNPVLIEIVTTNALGQWSSTIRSGCVGAAFVQHKIGAVYYTAPGNPFLGP